MRHRLFRNYRIISVMFWSFPYLLWGYHIFVSLVVLPKIPPSQVQVPCLPPRVAAEPPGLWWKGWSPWAACPC